MFARIRDSRMKMLLAALMALALLGAACGGGGDDEDATDTASEETEETPAEDEAGTLEFAGTEYAFSAPPTAKAGPTTITLVNNGDEPHMLDLVPLAENAPSVEKLLKMPQKKAQSFFAGPPIMIKPIKPGETSEPVEAELQPGRYGYVCFYAKKGEQPHAFQGMFGELTVE